MACMPNSVNFESALIIYTMERKSKTTYRVSDYLEWNTMLSLVRKLYRDGNYRISLLIGCGSFFGLRISDLLTLSWDMILDADSFTLYEKKTGKRRVVKVNKEFQRHIQNCYDALNISDDTEKCFISQKKGVYSVQRINAILKEVKSKYNLKIQNFSTHTMRKTFGRKVFESAGENANLALVRLSELFNHSNIAITKIYLGIRQEELLETYDLLDF